MRRPPLRRCAASCSNCRRMSSGSPLAGGQSALMRRAAKAWANSRSSLSPRIRGAPSEAAGLRLRHVATAGEITEELREILVIGLFCRPLAGTPVERLGLGIASREHHVRLRSPFLGKVRPAGRSAVRNAAFSLSATVRPSARPLVGNVLRGLGDQGVDVGIGSSAGQCYRADRPSPIARHRPEHARSSFLPDRRPGAGVLRSAPWSWAPVRSAPWSWVLRGRRPGAGPAEVGALELGIAEVGALELGSAEVGALELGRAEVGALELGPFEVGALELGTAEVGALEFGIAEVGALKLGREVGALESAPRDWRPGAGHR